MKKPMMVRYLEPCDANTPGAVNLYGDGKYFQFVKKVTDDPSLLVVVKLANQVGGWPWRDGDGESFTTRYGIRTFNKIN